MSTAIKDRIVSTLKEVLEEGGEHLEQMDPDQDLSSLGVNSVTFIRLVLAFEMEFGVSWDDEELDFQNFATINNIVNYVSGAMAAEA